MIEHDPGTGRLRIDAAGFAALWGEGPPGAAPRTAREAVAAGVIDEQGRPDAALAPSLDAMRDARCLVHVEIAGAAAVHVHQVWVADAGAAGLVQSGPDTFDFLPVPSDHVPALIADLLRLGPRKHVERGLLHVSEDSVDEVFSSDRTVRCEALDEWGGAHDRLVGRVEVAWAQDGEPSGRGLVVAGGPEGWWLARPDEGGANTLLPTSPSTLWTSLIGLLPTDEELGFA